MVQEKSIKRVNNGSLQESILLKIYFYISNEKYTVFSLRDERTWGGGETYVFMSK
jgi:hypothetical protein